MPLRINIKNAALYILFLAAMALCNRAVTGAPLALGLYFAMLACGANAVAAPLLYVLASAAHLNLTLTLLSLFESSFLCCVALIYRRTGRKMRIESAAYLIVALAPYIAFAPAPDIAGAALIGNAYILRAVCALLVLLFTPFCFRAVYALLFRLYRCRLRTDELVCCSVTCMAALSGLYFLTGGYVYAVICAGVIVFSVRLTKSPYAFFIALTLAVPAAAASLDITPITAAVAATALCLPFCRAGRTAPPLEMLCAAALYFYLTGEYGGAYLITAVKALALFCAVMPFAVPSDRRLEKIRDRLCCTERPDGEAVARSRRRTGERLYRLSEVFREIECAFSALDEKPDDGAARERMLEELKEKCCKSCEKNRRCARTDVYRGFKKLIDAGCIKGKANLIDLPSEITASCQSPAELLSRLNALLAEYRRYMTEAENARSGRRLLGEQAHGVSEAMRRCAAELCRSFPEYRAVGEELKLGLAAHGISCPEIDISGENRDVCLIAEEKKAGEIADVLSKGLGRKYILKDKLCYSAERCCMQYSAAPRYDAAFGTAFKVKEGGTVSGDTHSVIKIDERRFLMALSDGMGSGEYARRVSATAISLIEAFYRADMPEDTVLSTINKLLSFNRDERFACIDIAAINLETGSADFVKIGSPAGIIAREGEIRLLESSSLPLGILDSLRPAVSREKLSAGDIVVFMSDGITSAFPSQTELLEFLQTLSPLNPQSLADSILEGALAQTGGRATDDMTVVCSRIFEG